MTDLVATPKTSAPSPVSTSGDVAHIELVSIIEQLRQASRGESLDPAAAARSAEIIETLKGALDSAEDRLRDIADPSSARLVRFENGQFTFKAPIIPLMAEYLAQMLTASGGEPANYTETAFYHTALGELTLSLQRKSGKTPHELRMAAEAERDALRAELDALRFSIDDADAEVPDHG